MGRTVAGRFELIDEIGAGGVGAVWRAYDHVARRICAAKVIEQNGPVEFARVVREQGVRVRHRHVVSPYASAVDGGLVLIASELVRGLPLATLQADYGALPWRYVAEIGCQLLAGLSAVHAAGIVHRDVKPANVLLRSGAGHPEALLTDFGIGHLIDSPRLTRTGFVVGTPGYLAPEVLRGRPQPDPRQDLFAVGVVLWQMLSGQARPERLTERPRDVPDALWAAVSALLEPDPRHRPSDAASARARLREVVVEPLPLPPVGLDGEVIEVFDQVGPLPDGWREPTAVEAYPVTRFARPDPPAR